MNDYCQCDDPIWDEADTNVYYCARCEKMQDPSYWEDKMYDLHEAQLTGN